MLNNLIFPVKRLITIFALLCFASVAWGDTASSEELASLLSSFHGMSAEFKQATSGGKGNPGQISTGRMALQRPGKFRWEVTQPNPQLLIADGHYLWIYDIDLEQATRQGLDSNNASSPASLLSGSVASLQNRFQVTRLSATANTTGFHLKPNSGNDMFQWIELYFTSGKLTKMLLRDNLGSLNTFTFSQVQINPALSASLFHFKPPKGVEVIKN